MRWIVFIFSKWCCSCAVLQRLPGVSHSSHPNGLEAHVLIWSWLIVPLGTTDSNDLLFLPAFVIDGKGGTSVNRPQKSWMNISTRTSATPTPVKKPKRSWPRNAASQCHRWGIPWGCAFPGMRAAYSSRASSAVIFGEAILKFAYFLN